MYLVDTNVWIERLLDQSRSGEVGAFLGRTSADQLSITDFAYHSIGVVLSRLKRMDTLLEFTQDAFIDGAVSLVRLQPEDMAKVVSIQGQFQLDFDDAYQYVAAEKHGLMLVSLDADFDRTDRGRKSPADV